MTVKKEAHSWGWWLQEWGSQRPLYGSDRGAAVGCAWSQGCALAGKSKRCLKEARPCQWNCASVNPRGMVGLPGGLWSKYVTKKCRVTCPREGGLKYGGGQSYLLSGQCQVTASAMTLNLQQCLTSSCRSGELSSGVDPANLRVWLGFCPKHA